MRLLLKIISLIVISTVVCLIAPLYGCSGRSDSDPRYTSAQPDYYPGYGNSNGTYADAGINADGSSTNTNNGQDPAREIEEADIVKVVGETLYALNRYRGLYVIDISEPDQPEILGSLDLYGNPVEMYVRDNRVHAVLTDFHRVRQADGPTDGPTDVEVGSAVVVIDVAEPSSPTLVTHFQIPGYITDTRIVGEVLYAVSNSYSWLSYYHDDIYQDATYVLSIDVADPFDIHEVDRRVFQRNYGYDNHVHVTTEAIYVASTGYGSSGYESTIRYVDISDPAGSLAVGAEVTVPGAIWDRWQLNQHEDILRVITAEPSWSEPYPSVHTFRVSGPTQITHLASLNLTLPRPESLTAARFDGQRAYLVTFERTDPLFIVDLSDPAAPVQAGELEMPGWLDHIVPRGDRLIAVGHDDSDGSWHLALSLFDVSDVWNPTLLDREQLGESMGWVTDERDNMDKVLTVLDDQGLILMPFMQCGYADGTDYTCTGGVQLVDFTASALTLRGFATHNGYIRRALLVAGRLLTLSDQRLEVLDITDRDYPRHTAELVLSRQVNRLALVNNHVVQLVDSQYDNQTRLRIVSTDDPDLGPSLAELELEGKVVDLFVHGNQLTVVQYDYTSWQMILQTIDLTDPTQPLLGETLTLPDGCSSSGYYGYWGSVSLYPRRSAVVQVGDQLVFYVSKPSYSCDGACESDELLVVELRPDGPREVATLRLTDREWVTGLVAQGDQVYFSHYRHLQKTDSVGRPLVAFYLNSLDLSDPAQPALAEPINIPGVVVGGDSARGLLYTLDFQWSGTELDLAHHVKTIRVEDNTAEIVGEIALPEGIDQLVVTAETAWMVDNYYWYHQPDDNRTSTMGAIDLTDPQRPAIQAMRWLPTSSGAVTWHNDRYALVSYYGYIQGLLLYDVTNPAAPTLVSNIRTNGRITDVSERDGEILVSTGSYGVKRLALP